MTMELSVAAMKFGLVAFNYTFLFQLINTLILFLILRKLLFKPVSNFMKKREDDIKSEIEEAEKMEADAHALREAYELKLVQADEEGKEIIKNHTKRAEDRASEIIKEAETEAVLIAERAKKEIERDRVKAVNELKNQVAELTIMAASNVVGKELKEADHKDLIDGFISEVGGVQWQN